MNERIRELRSTLDLTQDEFGSRIGVKRNTIAKYETGKGNPIDSVIFSICRVYSVNEDWLRHGSGEMFIPAPNDEVEAIAQKYGLPDLAKGIMQEFVELAPSEMAVFLDFIVRVTERVAREKGITLNFNPSDYRMFKAAKSDDGRAGEDGASQTYQKLEDARDGDADGDA